MPDREKAISGLQELSDYLFHEYKVCYKGDEADCYERFLQANNALELLKEQEAQKPNLMQTTDGIWAACRKCGAKLWPMISGWTIKYDPDEIPKYCPKCGRAVKWDG